MGCDIHLYVEKRQADGSWAAVSGPNPRIANYREWAKSHRERGENDQADRLEADAAAVESGAKAKSEPDEEGYLSEYDNPAVFEDWLYDGRNYDLFGILANVRNGRGFAGVKTGLGFVPIAMPKDLPADVSATVKEKSDGWGCDGHSHSFHTVADLLAYDWHQCTFRQGVLHEQEYKHYKETGSPESWSGDVLGSSVCKISNEDMDALLAGTFARAPGLEYYTLCKWMVEYKGSAGSFYTDAMPKLQELAGDDPTSVRIVFWFDN